MIDIGAFASHLHLRRLACFVRLITNENDSRSTGMFDLRQVCGSRFSYLALEFMPDWLNHLELCNIVKFEVASALVSEKTGTQVPSVSRSVIRNNIHCKALTDVILA